VHFFVAIANRFAIVRTSPVINQLLKMNTPHYNKSALENAVNPHIEIVHEWIGKDGKQYRDYKVWLNEGWSRSFMQVKESHGWVGLY